MVEKYRKNSIVYLCLNQITIRTLFKLVAVFDLPVYLSRLLVLVLTLFILYLLAVLFTKTGLQVFIGHILYNNIKEVRHCLLRNIQIEKYIV